MTNAYEELKANRDAHEARRDRVKKSFDGSWEWGSPDAQSLVDEVMRDGAATAINQMLELQPHLHGDCDEIDIIEVGLGPLIIQFSAEDVRGVMEGKRNYAGGSVKFNGDPELWSI